MTSTLPEISTRLEIDDLLVAFAHAVDFRRWDLLERIFTPDGKIDVSRAGGRVCQVSEFVDLVEHEAGAFPSPRQHLNLNSAVHIVGETATVITDFSVLEVRPEPDGRQGDFIRIGGVYIDDLVRTEEGWRIRVRRILLLSHGAHPVDIVEHPITEARVATSPSVVQARRHVGDAQ